MTNKIYKHFLELPVAEQNLQIKKLIEESGCSIYVATATLVKFNFLYLKEDPSQHFECAMTDDYSDLVKTMIG